MKKPIGMQHLPHKILSKNSLRLTFTYERENITLESIKSIAMIAPPSDQVLEGENNQMGFWYEVRDKDNHTLYRRIVDSPIKYAIEVRTDDPNAPLKWEEIKDPKGIFVLLIPDIEGAQSVAIFIRPFKYTRDKEKALEITQFDISERDQGRGTE